MTEAIQTPKPIESEVTPEDEVTDEELAKKILSEKDVYAKSTQDLRKDMQEIWKAMNGELSAAVYPWENPQFIPKMRTEVSFVTPYIFSGEPDMEVTLEGDEDKAAAFILDKMLSYRTERQPKLFDVALSWVTQGVALGTSLLKVSWCFKPGDIVSDGTPIDRPQYSVPNILDIYVNPLIPNIEDQVSVIERVAMTVGDIKKSTYFNDNKLKVKAKGKPTNSDSGSETLDSTDLQATDQLNTEFEIIDVYERWTNESVSTIADAAEGPILLRDEPNPYKFIPYSKFIFEQQAIPNRFYGNGIGQNTLGLQEMHYDLFNLVMLNLKIVVNKMWRIDPGSRVNPSDLIARPGGTIRATKDEAEAVIQDDLKESGFNMLAMISDEHKRASGATDVIQASTMSRTMGQDQMAQNSAVNRFELARKRLKSALSRIGWMTLRMDINNLQSVDAEIMKIFPQAERAGIFQYIQMFMKDMIYDVHVQGDTIVAPNKDVMAKQLLDLYNLMANDLLPQEKRVFAREIARMRGIKNVKELIPDFQQPQIDPATGQPIMQGQPQGQPGQPVDGNMLPQQFQVPTQEGVNESVYGLEQPNSYQ